jgi:mannose-binding lectin 2
MIAGEEWSDCFTLKDISLPANPYIGLSSMTGDVSDAHEYAIFDSVSSISTLSDLNYDLFDSIISVSTSSAILSAPEAPRDTLVPPRPSKGWFPSFTKLLIFGIALAGIWYGWNTYGRRYFLGHAGSFGRGGGGMMWADSKRF